ncbi:Thiamine biosynthesis lipoprotein ApbE precursor [Pirellula sp. SH-Sr6A]|nr:Thiamine biosynthesis lipoprotein ApbE precursor [Pirellula sp. SH-Sr6A]
MGSNLDMVLYAESLDAARAAFENAIDCLERHSIPLNHYVAESEVNQLPSLSARSPRPISPVLARAIERSRQWFGWSQGAFDSTQRETIQLWSRARRLKTLPDPEAIQKALQRSTWEKIELREDAQRSMTITHEGPRLSLDVGGLAVGLLLDDMMLAIRESGITSALINAGGDIIVSDPPPNREGWSISVAGLQWGDAPLLNVELRNGAITSSGDLNQFAMIDGVRYGHIIDPRSGRPVSQRRSVTVIADQAIDADAGATALAALGHEESFRLSERMPIREVYYLWLPENETNPHFRTWVYPSVNAPTR